jgi:hypothetical protein
MSQHLCACGRDRLRNAITSILGCVLINRQPKCDLDVPPRPLREVGVVHGGALASTADCMSVVSY